MNRRTFMSALGAASTAPAASLRKTVAIQIPAVSFTDEGVEAVLDTVQQRARVNALFLITYAYNRGLSGRQMPGHPLPDHGKQQYDPEFQGGYYATPNPRYYRETVFQGFRAPELGDFDVLASVLPPARKRGLQCLAFLADNLPDKELDNLHRLKERDIDGKALNTVCFRNPQYRAFLLGMVEDCSRSYELDGLLWRSEAPGPISRVLGFTHQKPSRAACFCEHCAAAARGRGIDPARAREGYRKLEGFAKLAAAGRRPSDGYFTTFWRLLLAYPEILAWNGMWVDHLRENYRAVHAKVKEARPAMKVGWAIAHNNCFNPLFRAENDIQAMTPYSDFLKTVAYHNSGGERTVRYIDNITRSVFADLEKQQALEMIYSLTGHRQGPLSEIARTGFTPDFVFREARRAVEGVTGSPTEIWTGLDLDLPTEPGHAKCTPEGTREIVKAAFQGGAHGVILARKYSEMRLSTLSGAGEAVKELGIS